MVGVVYQIKNGRCDRRERKEEERTDGCFKVVGVRSNVVHCFR